MEFFQQGALDLEFFEAKVLPFILNHRAVQAGGDDANHRGKDQWYT